MLEWLHDTIGVDSRFGNEIRTKCPKCDHPNFYFNLSKKVGWCHRDTCHWNPTLQDLIEFIGYGPDEVGSYTREIEETKPIEITLPEGCSDLVFYSNGTLMTTHQEMVQYLLGRGVDITEMLRFEIKHLGERIYLPVKEEDTLLSYVSRSILYKGYLYPKGGRHAQTILGWDESKYWDSLTLVENSFVSLWLRKLNVSTNFGSHLTSTQLAKIAKSKVKSVVILWDEGADGAAEKAVLALRSLGIPAIFIKINGQPDDHSFETISEIIQEGHKNARQRSYWTDYRTKKVVQEV